MSTLKIYVGVKGSTRKVFRSSTVPTSKSHGDRYNVVIGPFRTLRGAAFMADYGRNNPHIQSVRDAEELAKIQAERESLGKVLTKATRKARRRSR